MPLFFIFTNKLPLSEQGTPRIGNLSAAASRTTDPHPCTDGIFRKVVLKNYLKQQNERCAAISKIAKSAPPFVCKGLCSFLLVLTFSYKKGKGF